MHFCFFILRDIHGGRRALVPLDTGGIRPAMGLVELRIYMYYHVLIRWRAREDNVVLMSLGSKWIRKASQVLAKC